MNLNVPGRLGALLSSSCRTSSRNCSSLGALQTLKVRQKIEEKRAAALLGGELSLKSSLINLYNLV